MRMIGGQDQNNGQKTKKILKISLIVLIVLFLIILTAVIILSFSAPKSLKVVRDQVQVAASNDLVMIDNTSGRIYISIEDFVKMKNAKGQTDYAYQKGEYKSNTGNTEDSTKGYIESKDEVATFSLSSDRIYKTPPGNEPDYEYFTIDSPVRSINGKLYMSPEGISIATNCKVSYNQEKNLLTVQSLTYLLESYKTKYTTAGYSGIGEDFNNAKALLYDMVIVNREGKYGVLSTLDDSSIIGTKYDRINFVEDTKEFFVTMNSKTGSLSTTGATQISLTYDEIVTLDSDSKLYVVSNNGKKGVVDQKGRIIVHLEYDKIGIDSNTFPVNKIKNGMFLYDNCIPVQQGERCGIFNKSGELIVPLEYTRFGYLGSTTKDKIVNNLLLVPQIEGIIVCKDNKYGIVHSTGRILAPAMFDKIYSVTNAGQDEYFLEYEGNTMKMADFIKANNITVVDNAANLENINQNEIDGAKTGASANTQATENQTAQNGQQ